MKLSHIFEQYQLKKNHENRQNDEENIIDMIVTDDLQIINLNLEIPRGVISKQDDDAVDFIKQLCTLTKSNNGQQNTNHLLDLFDDCKNENIIKIFKPIIKLINTNHGGYSEWYIPSHQELEELNHVEDFIGAKISRQFKIKKDWDEIKLYVMDYCLLQKFNQEPFKSKLLDTGDEYIMEGNWWGDKFWGVCLKTNIGDNNLGKLIMQIRSSLKNEYIKY